MFVRLFTAVRKSFDEQTRVTETHYGILFGLKKKAILTRATTWMNLEGVIPSEISQRLINTVDAPLTCSTQRGQVHGDRKESGGCQELGGRGLA